MTVSLLQAAPHVQLICQSQGPSLCAFLAESAFASKEQGALLVLFTQPVGLELSPFQDALEGDGERRDLFWRWEVPAVRICFRGQFLRPKSYTGKHRRPRRCRWELTEQPLNTVAGKTEGRAPAMQPSDHPVRARSQSMRVHRAEDAWVGSLECQRVAVSLRGGSSWPQGHLCLLSAVNPVVALPLCGPGERCPLVADRDSGAGERGSRCKNRAALCLEVRPAAPQLPISRFEVRKHGGPGFL